MKIHELLIRSEEDFIQAKELINEVFNIDRILPNQVFRGGYANFKFTSSGWVMALQADEGKDFWDILKEIAAVTKDEYVIFAVLDSYPGNFFLREFAYNNWLKLPIDLSSMEYKNALFLDAPSDEPGFLPSMTYCAESFFLTGSSMQWGIWIDADWEMCVLGLKEGVGAEPISQITKDWKSLEEVLLEGGGVTIRFDRADELYIKHKQEMMQNYGSQNLC